MRKLIWHLFAAIALIPLGGHFASAQPSDTIVKIVSAPRHPGVATLVPELTIGVAEGAPEYMFSSISELFVARDRSILVVDFPDGAAIQIRQYAPDGKFVRNIGRAGRGPGEYQAPTGVAQLPDGRLLVRDITSSRINVYSEAGEPLDTWSLPNYNYAIRGINGLRVDPRGAIYVPISLRVEGVTSPPTLRTVIARLWFDGTVIDTLEYPDLPALPAATVAATIATPGRPTSRTSMPVAYMPRVFSTWTASGYFITGATNRYAIDLRTPLPPGPGTNVNRSGPPLWRPGNAVTSIRRTLSPVPVSDVERREQRAYVEASLQRPGATLSQPIPETPAVKPLIKGVAVTADGRLWVSLSTPSEQFDPPVHATQPGQRARPVLRWREPSLYDVFEADGTYIGQASLPFDTTRNWIFGDIAWAVVRDADDVQVVKRFRIAWR